MRHKPQVLPAEEILYREGDIGDRMYFLHTGKILMSMPKESKKGKGAGERLMIRSKSGRALKGVSLIHFPSSSSSAICQNFFV